MASSSSRKKASRSNATPEYDSEPMEGDGDGGSEDDDENDDDDEEEDFEDDDDEDVGRKRKAPAKRATGSSQIKYLLTVVSFFFFFYLDFHGAADFGTLIFFCDFWRSVEEEKVALI